MRRLNERKFNPHLVRPRRNGVINRLKPLGELGEGLLKGNGMTAKIHSIYGGAIKPVKRYGKAKLSKMCAKRLAYVLNLAENGEVSSVAIAYTLRVGNGVEIKSLRCGKNTDLIASVEVMRHCIVGEALDAEG